MENRLVNSVGNPVKYFFAFVFVAGAGVSKVQGQTSAAFCDRSVQLLKKAVYDAENFFIKVHAAENLINFGYVAGLDTTFANLQKSSPDYFIGAARVLARLNKHFNRNDQSYIDQLLNQFKHAATRRSSLTALESLAKLGYRNRSAEIDAYADTGTIGFKGMARWVLSNDGNKRSEDKLSELLLSYDLYDYRYAAYAIRFKNRVDKLTVKRLRICFDRLDMKDIARVYLSSALFVHTNGKDKEKIRSVLITYLTGDVAQRYEVAEALGRAGDRSDLAIIQKLMEDENEDVRVAAANAALRVNQCKS